MSNLFGFLESIFKFAQLSEKAKAKILQYFRKKHEELDLDFDEERALRIIEAWDRLRRSPRTKNLVKPNIYDYKTLEDVFKDIVKSGRGINENYLRDILSKFEILSEGDTVGYLFRDTSDAKYLSMAAEGSDWCIRSESTAKDYLEGSAFVVIRQYKDNDRQGIPLYAILIDDEGNIQIFDSSDELVLDTKNENIYSEDDTDWSELADLSIQEISERYSDTKSSKTFEQLESIQKELKSYVESAKELAKSRKDFDLSMALSTFSDVSKKITEELRKIIDSSSLSVSFCENLMEILKDFGVNEVSILSFKNFAAKISSITLSLLKREEIQKFLDLTLDGIVKYYNNALEDAISILRSNKNLYSSQVEKLELSSKTLYHFLRKIYKALQEDKEVYDRIISNVHPLSYPIFSRVWRIGIIEDFDKKFLDVIKTLDPSLAVVFYRYYLKNVIIHRRSFGTELSKLKDGFYGDLMQTFFEEFLDNVYSLLEEKMKANLESYISEIEDYYRLACVEYPSARSYGRESEFDKVNSVTFVGHVLDSNAERLAASLIMVYEMSSKEKEEVQEILKNVSYSKRYTSDEDDEDFDDEDLEEKFSPNRLLDLLVEISDNLLKNSISGFKYSHYGIFADKDFEEKLNYRIFKGIAEDFLGAYRKLIRLVSLDKHNLEHKNYLVQKVVEFVDNKANYYKIISSLFNRTMKKFYKDENEFLEKFSKNLFDEIKSFPSSVPTEFDKREKFSYNLKYILLTLAYLFDMDLALKSPQQAYDNFASKVRTFLSKVFSKFEDEINLNLAYYALIYEYLKKLGKTLDSILEKEIENYTPFIEKSLQNDFIKEAQPYVSKKYADLYSVAANFVERKINEARLIFDKTLDLFNPEVIRFSVNMTKELLQNSNEILKIEQESFDNMLEIIEKFNYSGLNFIVRILVSYLLTGKVQDESETKVFIQIASALVKYGGYDRIVAKEVVKELFREKTDFSNPQESNSILDRIEQDTYGLIKSMFGSSEEFYNVLTSVIVNNFRENLMREVYFVSPSIKFLVTSRLLDRAKDFVDAVRERAREYSEKLKNVSSFGVGQLSKEEYQFAVFLLTLSAISPKVFLPILENDISDEYAYLVLPELEKRNPDLLDKNNWAKNILQEKSENVKRKMTQGAEIKEENEEKFGSVYTSFASFIRHLYKLAQLSEKARRQILETFRNKHKKLGLSFDEDRSLRIIDAWDKLRRSPRTKDLVKQNIYEYKTIEDILEDIKKTGFDFDSKYLRDILEEYKFVEEGDTVGYMFSGPDSIKYLSLASKGSDWCLRNIETAREYLVDLGVKFVILRSYSKDDKEGKPLYAIVIHPNGILSIYDAHDNTVLRIERETCHLFSRTINLSESDLFDKDIPEIFDEVKEIGRQHTANLISEISDRLNSVYLEIKPLVNSDKEIPLSLGDLFKNLTKTLKEISVSVRVDAEFWKRLVLKLENMLSPTNIVGIKHFIREVALRSSYLDDKDALNTVSNTIIDKLIDSYNKILDIFKYVKVRSHDVSYLLDSIQGFAKEIYDFLRKIYQITNDESIFTRSIEKLHPIVYPAFSKVWKVGIIEDVDKEFSKYIQGITAKEFALSLYSRYFDEVIFLRRSFGYEFKKIKSKAYGDVTPEFSSEFFRNFVNTVVSKAQTVLSSYISDINKMYEKILSTFLPSNYEFESYRFSTVFRCSLLSHAISGGRTRLALLLRILYEIYFNDKDFGKDIGVEDILNKLSEISDNMLKNSIDFFKNSQSGLFKDELFSSEVHRRILLYCLRGLYYANRIFFGLDRDFFDKLEDTSKDKVLDEIVSSLRYKSSYFKIIQKEIEQSISTILPKKEYELEDIVEYLFEDISNDKNPSLDSLIKVSERLKLLFSLLSYSFDVDLALESPEKAYSDYSSKLDRILSYLTNRLRDTLFSNIAFPFSTYLYLEKIGQSYDNMIKERIDSYRPFIERSLKETFIKKFSPLLSEKYKGVLDVLPEFSSISYRDTANIIASILDTVDPYADNLKDLNEDLKRIAEIFPTNKEESEKEAEMIIRYIRDGVSEYSDLITRYLLGTEISRAEVEIHKKIATYQFYSEKEQNRICEKTFRSICFSGINFETLGASNAILERLLKDEYKIIEHVFGSKERFYEILISIMKSIINNALRNSIYELKNEIVFIATSKVVEEHSEILDEFKKKAKEYSDLVIENLSAIKEHGIKYIDNGYLRFLIDLADLNPKVFVPIIEDYICDEWVYFYFNRYSINIESVATSQDLINVLEEKYKNGGEKMKKIYSSFPNKEGSKKVNKQSSSIKKLILDIIKFAQLSEKAKMRILETFKKRHDKLGLSFDENRALRIIEAWDRLRRSPRTKDFVKANIYDYKTLEEIFADIERSGENVFHENADYIRSILRVFAIHTSENLEVYSFENKSDSKYLSLASEGSSWCIRSSGVAKSYLEEGNRFLIVRYYQDKSDKVGIPIYALVVDNNNYLTIYDTDDREVLKATDESAYAFDSELSLDVLEEMLNTEFEEIDKANIKKAEEEIEDQLNDLKQTVESNIKSLEKRNQDLESKYNAIESSFKEIQNFFSSIISTYPLDSKTRNVLFEKLKELEVGDVGLAAFKYFVREVPRSIFLLGNEYLESFTNRVINEIIGYCNYFLNNIEHLNFGDKYSGDYLANLSSSALSKIYMVLKTISNILKKKDIYDRCYNNLHPLAYPYFSKAWKVGILEDYDVKFSEIIKSLPIIPAREYYSKYLDNIIINRRSFGFEFKKLQSNFYGDYNPIFNQMFFDKVFELVEEKILSTLRSYLSDIEEEFKKEVKKYRREIERSYYEEDYYEEDEEDYEDYYYYEDEEGEEDEEDISFFSECNSLTLTSLILRSIDENLVSLIRTFKKKFPKADISEVLHNINKISMTIFENSLASFKYSHSGLFKNKDFSSEIGDRILAKIMDDYTLFLNKVHDQSLRRTLWNYYSISNLYRFASDHIKEIVKALYGEDKNFIENFTRRLIDSSFTLYIRKGKTSFHNIIPESVLFSLGYLVYSFDLDLASKSPEEACEEYLEKARRFLLIVVEKLKDYVKTIPGLFAALYASFERIGKLIDDVIRKSVGNCEISMEDALKKEAKKIISKIMPKEFKDPYYLATIAYDDNASKLVIVFNELSRTAKMGDRYYEVIHPAQVASILGSLVGSEYESTEEALNFVRTLDRKQYDIPSVLVSYAIRDKDFMELAEQKMDVLKEIFKRTEDPVYYITSAVRILLDEIQFKNANLSRPEVANEIINNILNDEYGLIESFKSIGGKSPKEVFLDLLASSAIKRMAYLIEEHKDNLINKITLFVFGSNELLDRYPEFSRIIRGIIRRGNYNVAQVKTLYSEDIRLIESLGKLSEVNPSKVIPMVEEELSDYYAYLFVKSVDLSRYDFPEEFKNVLKNKYNSFSEKIPKDKNSEPSTGEDSANKKESSIKKMVEDIFKFSQLSDKAKSKILEHFRKKHEKFGLSFDEEQALRIIDAWDKLRRSEKTKKFVKENIYEYKTLTEILEDVKKSGYNVEPYSLRDVLRPFSVMEIGRKVIYLFTDPSQAKEMSLAAKGSDWCIRSVDNSNSYLKRGEFVIIREYDESYKSDGVPILAIFIDKNGKFIDCYDRYDERTLSLSMENKVVYVLGENLSREDLSKRVKVEEYVDTSQQMQRVENSIDRVRRTFNEIKKSLEEPSISLKLTFLAEDLSKDFADIDVGFEVDEELSENLARLINERMSLYSKDKNARELIKDAFNYYLNHKVAKYSLYNIKDEKTISNLFSNLIIPVYEEYKNVLDEFINLANSVPNNENASIVSKGFDKFSYKLFRFLRFLSEKFKSINIPETILSRIHIFDYPTFSDVFKTGILDEFDKKYTDFLRSTKSVVTYDLYEKYLDKIIINRSSFGYELNKLKENEYGNLTESFTGLFTKKIGKMILNKLRTLYVDRILYDLINFVAENSNISSVLSPSFFDVLTEDLVFQQSAFLFDSFFNYFLKNLETYFGNYENWYKRSDLSINFKEIANNVYKSLRDFTERTISTIRYSHPELFRDKKILNEIVLSVVSEENNDVLEPQTRLLEIDEETRKYLKDLFVMSLDFRKMVVTSFYKDTNLSFADMLVDLSTARIEKNRDYTKSAKDYNIISDLEHELASIFYLSKAILLPNRGSDFSKVLSDYEEVAKRLIEKILEKDDKHSVETIESLASAGLFVERDVRKSIEILSGGEIDSQLEKRVDSLYKNISEFITSYLDSKYSEEDKKRIFKYLYEPHVVVSFGYWEDFMHTESTKIDDNEMNFYKLGKSRVAEYLGFSEVYNSFKKVDPSELGFSSGNFEYVAKDILSNYFYGHFANFADAAKLVKGFFDTFPEYKPKLSVDFIIEILRYYLNNTDVYLIIRKIKDDTFGLIEYFVGDKNEVFDRVIEFINSIVDRILSGEYASENYKGLLASVLKDRDLLQSTNFLGKLENVIKSINERIESGQITKFGPTETSILEVLNRIYRINKPLAESIINRNIGNKMSYYITEDENSYFYFNDIRSNSIIQYKSNKFKEEKKKTQSQAKSENE